MTMTDKVHIEQHPDLVLDLEPIAFEDAAILHLSGLIDSGNSDHFRKQAQNVINSGYFNLIIDGTRTTFLSSTGIGAFTALLKLVREKGGSLNIYGMPQKIYDVFQLLGFTTFFRFYSSREDALQMLGSDAEPDMTFPLKFQCPVCQKNLKAPKAGRFRCASCRIILAVDRSGSVNLG